MSCWDSLNQDGRIQCRRFYRSIRNLGQSRAEARKVMIGVSFGFNMAPYWAES